LSSLTASVTAVAAALALGISSVADQRSTKRVESRRTLSPRILLDLGRQPLWLTAIAMNLVGFALQVVALSFGSLALVQPILVCDLIFAVVISWSLRWRSQLHSPGIARSALTVFGGVAACTAGVAGFLAIGQPSAGHNQASFSMLPPLVIGLVVVAGGCLVVAARNQNLRPLALALACGVNYGVAAFVVKLLTSEFGEGLARVFTNWPIYVLLVVGPTGFILNQDAFQQGRFLAPVQSIISATDPVISIALGVIWLDVRLRSSPGAIAAEVLFLLLMIIGIFITANYAPAVAAPSSRPSPSASDQAGLQQAP
jgi:hypothetical protein